MKMLLLAVILFPLYLFSADQSSETIYKEGLKLYKSKDFKGSYEKFHSIYLDKLNDSRFNFYLGRTAYETGHYRVALAAFERVEMQDGSNLRNKLEMARTYYMLKMFEDSQNAFKEVLANPDIPQNVRRNIELALSRVSKVQQNSFTYARIAADVLYDSNINYASIGGYDTERYGHLDGRGRISDLALEVFADVTNVYDIGDKGGYAIKNSFSFFTKDYDDYNDYDLQYFGYNPSIIYQETLYTAELVLGIDTLQVNRKKFNTNLSIMPRFEYNHSATLTSISHLKYQKKNYKDNLKKLDSKRYEFAYGLQDILSPRSYVRGNLYYIKENRVRGSNTYVNFKEYKTNINYVNQLNSVYGLDFFGQARSRKYKETTDVFGNRRSDVGFLGSAALSIKLQPTLIFKIKTSYEHVDSNQDNFTWQKFTASAGIIKTF
jgi:hypothetical protein